MGYNQKYKRIAGTFHVSRFTFQEKGFSLFEVLIAISVFAVVGVLAAQLIGVSLQSETVSAQKTVALQLAQEEIEAVEALSAQYWQNIYGLAKGSGTKYYTVASGGAWATSTTSTLAESMTINGTPYTRYFYIENVSRDTATKDIETTYTASRDDPSTQKVTVVVSWQNSALADIGTVTIARYLTRARNAAAAQTDWSGAADPTPGETGNFGTNYSAIQNISTAGGSLQLQ